MDIEEVKGYIIGKSGASGSKMANFMMDGAKNPFILEENEDRHTVFLVNFCRTVLCGPPDQVGDDGRTGRG